MGISWLLRRPKGYRQIRRVDYDFETRSLGYAFGVTLENGIPRYPKGRSYFTWFQNRINPFMISFLAPPGGFLENGDSL